MVFLYATRNHNPPQRMVPLPAVYWPRSPLLCGNPINMGSPRCVYPRCRTNEWTTWATHTWSLYLVPTHRVTPCGGNGGYRPPPPMGSWSCTVVEDVLEGLEFMYAPCSGMSEGDTFWEEAKFYFWISLWKMFPCLHLTLGKLSPGLCNPKLGSYVLICSQPESCI